MRQAERDHIDVLDRRASFRSGVTDEDRSMPRRGGKRSRIPGERTRDELYEEAKALEIPGRSAMDKRELEMAIDRRRGRRR